jgi:hypothetical protein
MPDSNPGARGFSRSAVEDPVKIILVKSVCISCGFTIIGSVVEGLRETEYEHFVNCDKNSD